MQVRGAKDRDEPMAGARLVADQPAAGEARVGRGRSGAAGCPVTAATRLAS